MKYFPVLVDPDIKWSSPSSKSFRKIPWDIVEPYRKRIELNHCGQTLEGLAERGGLSVEELHAAFIDKSLRDFFNAKDSRYAREDKINSLVFILVKVVQYYQEKENLEDE